MTDPRKVSRLLVGIADLLEGEGRGIGGIVREGARLLAELGEVTPEPLPGRCRGCGEPIERTGQAGRPREWCLNCRPRDRRAAKSAAEYRLAA